MLSRVTLDQLQILIAVADTGNFSAAARKVNRVQSAVSQSIQSLEDGLELKLFDRSSKVPRLTERSNRTREGSSPARMRCARGPRTWRPPHPRW